MLDTLAKVCSEHSVIFKLGNERCISCSVADKNLTNVGLDIGANGGNNGPTRRT